MPAGIASAEVVKYQNRTINGRLTYAPSGYAGYFVAAAKIAKFLPDDLHL